MRECDVPHPGRALAVCTFDKVALSDTRQIGASLSWAHSGSKGFTVLANPIYVMSPMSPQIGSALIFEVLADDAELLEEELIPISVFT